MDELVKIIQAKSEEAVEKFPEIFEEGKSFMMIIIENGKDFAIEKIEEAEEKIKKMSST